MAGRRSREIETGEREWLTTGQAARLCSVRTDTVLKWIKRGKLRAERTAGGHHRIPRCEIEPLILRSPALVGETPPSRPLRCWEYLGRDGEPEACRSCIVYRSRAAWCFRMVGRARELGHSLHRCPGSCEDCAYFRRVAGVATNFLVVTRDEALERALQEENECGLRFRFARDGYEVSAAVRDFRPDFVVVDAAVLREGEESLLTRLAADPRAPGVRAILAVRKGERDRARARQRSSIVVAVIERPFAPDDLASVVRAFPVETRAAAADDRRGASGGR